MQPVADKICYRQGYNCQCEFCLPWIKKWDKEVDGFALFANLLKEGKTLFYIYERMRVDHADVLRMYDLYLEDKYIEHWHATKLTKPKQSRKRERDEVVENTLESDKKLDNDGSSRAESVESGGDATVSSIYI